MVFPLLGRTGSPVVSLGWMILPLRNLIIKEKEKEKEKRNE